MNSKEEDIVGDMKTVNDGEGSGETSYNGGPPTSVLTEQTELDKPLTSREGVSLQQVVSTEAEEKERKEHKRDRDMCYALLLLSGCWRHLWGERDSTKINKKSKAFNSIKLYLNRLNPFWTCTEDRQIYFDENTRKTLQHTYWLSRIVSLLLHLFLLLFSSKALS